MMAPGEFAGWWTWTRDNFEVNNQAADKGSH
jgi:hypothetical protein